MAEDWLTEEYREESARLIEHIREVFGRVPPPDEETVRGYASSSWIEDHGVAKRLAPGWPVEALNGLYYDALTGMEPSPLRYVLGAVMIASLKLDEDGDCLDRGFASYFELTPEVDNEKYWSRLSELTLMELRLVADTMRLYGRRDSAEASSCRVSLMTFWDHLPSVIGLPAGKWLEDSRRRLPREGPW
jgi:hypothetical protein